MGRFHQTGWMDRKGLLGCVWGTDGSSWLGGLLAEGGRRMLPVKTWVQQVNPLPQGPFLVCLNSQTHWSQPPPPVTQIGKQQGASLHPSQLLPTSSLFHPAPFFPHSSGLAQQRLTLWWLHPFSLECFLCPWVKKFSRATVLTEIFKTSKWYTFRRLCVWKVRHN